MSPKQTLQKYWEFMMMAKPAYFSAMALMLVGTLFRQVGPYLYGEIINNIEGDAMGFAIFLVVVLLSANFIGDFLKIIKDYMIDEVLIKAQTSAKLQYMQALHNVDYEYHTNKSSGSLISLSKRGEMAIQIALDDVNSEALRQIIEFAISLAFLSLVSWEISALLALVLIGSVLINWQLIKRNIALRKKFNKEDDKITGLIVDNMIGFETVKLFAQEQWEYKRLNKAFVPWKKALFKFAMYFRYIDLSLSVSSLIGIGIVFAFGLSSIQAGTMSIGGLVTAMVYVFGITRGSNNLVWKLRNLAKTSIDLEQYFTIMGLKPTVNDLPNAQTLGNVTGQIKFEDVHFEYQKGLKVLSGINLKIEPGETIALVGVSGGGKTTLTKLLMRYYDVSSGSIKLDNRDIREIKLHDLRRAIGLVPQEPVMFNETIRYNIAYGNPLASQEEIEHAAKQASLHEFIASLPEGYETVVGERGIKLSGGQKQRLAIARVILEDPEVVIFDEATSQLDSENERKIQDAFTNLTREKTTIAIAHRLSTIMSADRIIVFAGGEIAEQGPHTELIKNNGVYNKLWTLQTEASNQTM